MNDDDLACPSCWGQDFEVGILGEPPSSFIIECPCGWTCEGEGIDWRAQLVPYEGDSTEEWPQEGWPLTSEADGPGEPPGW